MTLRPLAVAVSLVTAACTGASAQDPGAAVERYFTALADAERFNGIALVAVGDSVVYHAAFGPADFGTGRPNRPESPFPIASATKPITAAAILRLREQGKVRLTDPVGRHLPGFPYDSITVINLLGHTSGLEPYDAYFAPVRAEHPDTVFTNADVVPRMATVRLPLVSAPGTAFRYNNLNYVLLALVVERASGRSFERYLTEAVFEPAGMRSTRWSPVYSGVDDSRLAMPHRYRYLYSTAAERPDTLPDVSAYWRTYRFQGFGELISTAPDLFRFTRALWDGRLLDAPARAEIATPVKLADGSPNPAGYGLGWEVSVRDSVGGTVVSHTGAQIGLRVILLRSLEGGETVILADNAGNEVGGIADNVLRILHGLEVPPPRRSLAREWGRVLVTEGIAAGRERLARLLADSTRYDADEDEINLLGYHLLRTEHLAEALEVFETNTRLHPESWNVWDSYGEALAAAGRREEAVAMYEKSLRLNPESASGKEALARLRAR